MKKLIYLMVASSFLAAEIIGIDIKIMQMSLFRGTLLLITVFFVLESLRANTKINISFKDDNSIFIKFYFFWFVYSIFSIGWVQDYNLWIRSVFFIGCGFLCIMILSHYISTKKDFAIIFTIMMLMIFLHNIIGWHELLTGVYRFADLVAMDPYNQFGWNPTARVPISMLGNPNNYATLLLFGVFITYVNLTNTKSKIIKLLCYITILSSVVLIFKTDSRANMLGLIIGVIVFIYMRYFKKKGIKALLLFIIFPVILFAFFNKFETLVMTIFGKLQFDFASSSGSDAVRMNLIKNGLIFLKETIGFGTGAGNIEYWMTTRKVYYVGNITNMHNWWMEILVGYGVAVFIGYLWVYLKMINKLYYVFNNSNDKFIQSTSLAFLCWMVSFIVASVSSSSNISQEWLWLFWGVVISFIRYVEKNKDVCKDSNL